MPVAKGCVIVSAIPFEIQGKTMRKKLLCLATTLACLAQLPSQGVTILEGPDPASLDVRILNEQALATSTLLLQSIEVRPIEITGRTSQEWLQTDRGRRVERHGLLRIELPDGGRIFHYSRQAGQIWGYLMVPTNGVATVLLEQPALNGASPFADRLAIATDSKHALIPLIDGDCFIARLDGSTFASTQTPVRFVATESQILPPSPQVGPNCAFFQTEEKLWRLPLADGNTPTDITPPLAPEERLKEELALSGDGSTIAFLVGSNRLYNIHMAKESGSATTLIQTPSEYEECNYLPEATGELGMLLNHDGTRLFYIDETGHDELLMLDTTGSFSPINITDDQFFEPTIGIHILPSFHDAALIIAIGREDQMDWFKAELTPTGGRVVNLTGTGALTTPFPQGALAPSQITVVGDRLLASDTVNGLQDVRELNPTSESSALVSTQLSAPPTTGSAIHATPHVIGRGFGDRIFSGTTGQLIAAAPRLASLTDPVSSPLLNATIARLTPTFGVVAIYFEDGSFLSTGLESGIEQIVLTVNDSLLIKGPTLRRISMLGSETVSLPAHNFQVIISGAGG